MTDRPAPPASQAPPSSLPDFRPTSNRSGASPLTALLLAGGGLALVGGAENIAYAVSSSQTTLILLLLLGLGGAGAAISITSTPARGQFDADATVNASMVGFALGLVTLAYGALQLLAVIIR